MIESAPPSSGSKSTGQRLTDLESAQADTSRKVESIDTIKRVGGAIAAALLGSLITGAIVAGQYTARVDALERDFRHHVEQPMHPGSAGALAEIRADQRVMQAELRQVAATVQDVRERVERIETQGRRVPR